MRSTKQSNKHAGCLTYQTQESRTVAGIHGVQSWQPHQLLAPLRNNANVWGPLSRGAVLQTPANAELVISIPGCSPRPRPAAWHWLHTTPGVLMTRWCSSVWLSERVLSQSCCPVLWQLLRRQMERRQSTCRECWSAVRTVPQSHSLEVMMLKHMSRVVERSCCQAKGGGGRTRNGHRQMQVSGQQWRNSTLRHSEVLSRYALMPSLFMSSGRYTGETVLWQPCWNGMDSPEVLPSCASATFSCFFIGSQGHLASYP